MVNLLVEYKSTVFVTLIYLTLYYVTLIVILLTKLKVRPAAQAQVRKDNENKKTPHNEKLIALDKYIRREPLMMAAERTQLNMLEQMPPFLATFWIYSVMVDPVVGAWMGALYTAIRACYFFLWPRYHYVVTLPNYAIIAFFAFGITKALLF